MSLPEPSPIVRIQTRAGPLDLLADGAVLEPATRTLLVADVHLGKAEVFRRQGVPVPAATSGETLARLTASVTRWRPERLIILGDLIHGHLPASHPLFDELASWRKQHRELTVSLLRGNHDRNAGTLPARCEISEWPQTQRLQQFELCHEPEEATDGLMGMCGHWHPVVRLRSRHDSARLRCFWLRESMLVLPAFGAFTGGHPIRPSPTDAVFLLDGNLVHSMSGKFDRKKGRR